MELAVQDNCLRFSPASCYVKHGCAARGRSKDQQVSLDWRTIVYGGLEFALLRLNWVANQHTETRRAQALRFQLLFHSFQSYIRGTGRVWRVFAFGERLQTTLDSAGRRERLNISLCWQLLARLTSCSRSDKYVKDWCRQRILKKAHLSMGCGGEVPVAYAYARRPLSPVPSDGAVDSYRRL